MEEYTSSGERYTHRVGLIGGTFDPIHYGHLVIAEEVRAALNLTEMIFIPAGHPPHKSEQLITPAQYRVAMLERAIASNPHFSISLIEVERTEPSYTADTLRLLREQWGQDTALYFVIGWDSLEELHTWYEPQEMLTQLTHLVAVKRPGYEEEAEYTKILESRLPGISQKLLVISAPQLEISATELRQRVAEGRPIKYQLPESVEQYIATHKLYQT